MKIYSKVGLLVSALILSNCTTIGGEFCINNGYEKKSAGYKQCTARYQANRELYDFCSKREGVISEGPQLEQCLINAKSLRSKIKQDKGFCNQEVSAKFSPAFSKPKQEKQPTLTDNGDLVVGNVVLGSPYSSAERSVYTTPYFNSCVTAHGWYNPNAWQDGKRNVGVREVTSSISKLNKQPVKIKIHEHSSVKLFSAAAEGNIYLVEQAINNSSANANTTNHQGYTALHVAARRGHFLVVQALMERFSANPDAISHKGESAISLASVGRHHGIVNYITEFKLKKERELIQRQLQNSFSTKECRTGTQKSKIDGKEQTIPITMCKQPNGIWKVAPDSVPSLGGSYKGSSVSPSSSGNEKNIDEAVHKLLEKLI